MTADAALALMAAMLRTAVFLAGPLLLVSLASGLVVGLVQTATQINEASVSFVVKVIAVLVTVLAVGPMMAGYAVGYARASISAIETVVH